MEISFDVPPITLTGEMTECKIVEHGGVNPTNNIRSDQDWDLQVEWYLKGWILDSAFFEFLGEWTVHLYLESMGPGDEYAFDVVVPVSTFTPEPGDSTRRNYEATIELSPGDVAPGTYTAVGAITYGAGATPGPIAAHAAAEPDMVQIYQV